MAEMPKDYFKKQFGDLKLYKSGNGYSLKFDFTPVGIKLDQAQDALDRQVWIDIQKYMPLDTGNLISQTNVINSMTRGMVYFFPPESDYGHYQYEGVVYVDPVYQVGAFYSPEYGFWSRPGVTKVPSDRLLTYSQPMAQAHWGEVAYENHHEEWADVVRRALQ